MREQLSRLTLADVNRAIKQHLKSDRMRVVVITKDAEGLRDAIASGKPSPITYNSPKPQEIMDEDKVIQLKVTSVPARSHVPVSEGFKRAKPDRAGGVHVEKTSEGDEAYSRGSRTTVALPHCCCGKDSTLRGFADATRGAPFRVGFLLGWSGGGSDRPVSRTENCEVGWGPRSLPPRYCLAADRRFSFPATRAKGRAYLECGNSRTLLGGLGATDGGDYEDDSKRIMRAITQRCAIQP